jgi:hypothetical protein
MTLCTFNSRPLKRIVKSKSFSELKKLYSVSEVLAIKSFWTKSAILYLLPLQSQQSFKFCIARVTLESSILREFGATASVLLIKAGANGASGTVAMDGAGGFIARADLRLEA